MRLIENCRKYECRMADGGWVPVEWTQLDVGDVVRQFPSLPDDPYHTPDPFIIDELPHLRICSEAEWIAKQVARKNAGGSDVPVAD